MKKFFIVFSVFASVSLFLTPLQAHAQDWGGCVDATTKIASLKCLPIVFSNVVRGALMFAGAVAIFLIIYGGIKLGMSGGDQKQVQGARQILTQAIIGLVLILSSFAIIFLISYLTGAKCITSFGTCQ